MIVTVCTSTLPATNNFVRSRFWIKFALLLLFTASPVFLHAQFQKPTEQELHMTSDPDAPGAAAVYLDYKDETDDTAQVHTVYARIKVLTEKGKKLATVDIPYENAIYTVEDIRGRTIHPDGTVIPLVGKPEDLLLAKSTGKIGDQFRVARKVFTLPNVEVGSIIEYFYRIHFTGNHISSPDWEIQGPYFVKHAHYSFIPFQSFLPGRQNATLAYVEDEHGNPANDLYLWKVLPGKITLKPDVVGHFVLDLKDIPAAPEEDWAPPSNTYLYQVHFYYVNGANVAHFWTNEGKYWSKDVDRFAKPSKAIKDAVASIVAPGDTDLQKAEKLYKAVQTLDNTDFSRQKSASEMKQLKLKVAKSAEDTWKQKSGSSQDITLLYLAMLRAAGLTAYDMKVVDRNRSIFDPNNLEFYQFDDNVVVLDIAGKEVVLDPGSRMCPFLMLDWKHADTGGIRQTADGTALASTPPVPYTENTTLRLGDITLDAHGVVTGNLRFVFTGQRALHWRQAALLNDMDEVKKQFDHELETMVPAGVEAHIDHFQFLDDPGEKLIAFCNVHGNLGAASSKHLLIPAFFLETRGGEPFVTEEKRQESVDMHYAEQSLDKVVYHLPAGFVVDGAPQKDEISWQGHAIFATRAETAPGEIAFVRQLSRAFTYAKPEEYQDLRGFYQKVAAADQGELVLTKKSDAKGN